MNEERYLMKYQRFVEARVYHPLKVYTQRSFRLTDLRNL